MSNDFRDRTDSLTTAFDRLTDAVRGRAQMAEAFFGYRPIHLMAGDARLAARLHALSKVPTTVNRMNSWEPLTTQLS